MGTWAFETVKSCGILAILLCGCGTADAPPRLRVTGASTVYPIMMLAAEEFQEAHGIRIEAQAGGSTRGFEDTLAGRNDLGAMARELTADEKLQVESFPIALDGVGIVVNKANGVSGVTTEELRRIYRKEVTNWSDLGGTEEEIVVVNKADGHATLTVFLEQTGLVRDEIQADASAGDNAQVIRLVANAKGAVGYVSMGEVIEAAAIGMQVRLVSLDAVEPTVANVIDGSWPMCRTLYLVSKGEPSSDAALLLDYLRRPDGERAIKRGNYVPLP